MRKPRIVKFPRAKVGDDDKFIYTLLWLIEEARKGKVIAYAMSYIVELPNGNRRFVEGSKAADDNDAHTLLGIMRRAEVGYINRNWPEDVPSGEAS